MTQPILARKVTPRYPLVASDHHGRNQGGFMMRVLIACESSGTVRRAFAARGHYAVSCDLLPADDGETVMHRTGDVLPLLGLRSWDIVIAHPPCTYLTVSNNNAMAHGCSKYTAEQGKALRADGVAFFREFIGCAPRVCIENPIGVMSRLHRKPDQYIQPWQFGDAESKKTCLWLKNLPPLVPTNVLPLPPSGRWANQTPSGQNKLGPSADRWKERSKTYQGIADAMAAQWGGLG